MRGAGNVTLLHMHRVIASAGTGRAQNVAAANVVSLGAVEAACLDGHDHAGERHDPVSEGFVSIAAAAPLTTILTQSALVRGALAVLLSGFALGVCMLAMR